MKNCLDNVVEKIQILQEGYDYMDLELAELENKVFDKDSNVKASEDYEIVDIVPGPVSKYDEGIQSQGIYDTALLNEIRDDEIEDIMKIGGRDAVAETIASSENKNSIDSYGKVDANYYSYKDEDNEELYNRFVNMDDEDLSNEMPLSQVDVWSYYDESPVIWQK